MIFCDLNLKISKMLWDFFISFKVLEVLFIRSLNEIIKLKGKIKVEIQIIKKYLIKKFD